MSKDEQAVETEIRAKGLTAPRFTPDDISNTIADIYFHRVPNTTCTVCALTLRNGYVVIGTSAAVSAGNFDKGLGEKIAFEDARSQIGALEGYLLRSRLADASPITGVTA